MVRYLRGLDYGLIITTILICLFGEVVIFSVSPDVAWDQLRFMALGFLVFFLATLLDIEIIKYMAIPFYLIILTLLLFTRFVGTESFGATRWLVFGGVTIQPSEISKLVLTLTLSAYLSSSRANTRSLIVFATSLLLLIFPALLVFIQPDLGTTLVLIFIWIIISFIAAFPAIYFGISIIITSLLSLPSWFILKDYQKQRILTFFSPDMDPLGAGYNVLQSIIAVGSGELFGRGFGRGTQSHLKFLPAHHTDFIFASLTEEWGFFGGLVLLGLFCILLWRIIEITKRANDTFSLLIGSGIFGMILFQVIVNIGMNIGILPVTGIPLPLISSGGSSLITVLLSLGIMQSLALRRRI